MKRVAVMVVFLMVSVLYSTAWAEDYGVYVKAVEKIAAPFDEVVKSVETALTKRGMDVLASYNASVPQGCRFKAHTIVFNSHDYASKLSSHGVNAAFALPLRIGIYTDAKGVNVSFLNPSSINRTALGDGTEKQLSVNMMKDLSTLLASAVTGSVVDRQIGEIRSKGRVGGRGGGDFVEKVMVIKKVADSGKAFDDTVTKVKEGLSSNPQGWRLVYQTVLPNGAVVFGTNKAATEAKAFEIAGERRESSDNSCPGIDHASAFPVEVVVYREGGQVKVVLLDEMYRMKVYFEDAGNWAFMKNMSMPGQIEKEITAAATSKLK